MNGEKTRVYFAGALFSSKDIVGNRLVAEAVERLAPRYEMVLPQDFEQGRADPRQIRDCDIRAVLSCDIGVFNYDGAELDSGTVVEFMLAKFLDRPALLLRTDFRGGGDQTYGPGGEPWNLMTSFFPRTRTLLVDSAALYKDFLAGGAFDCRGYCDSLALRIAAELDALSGLPPLMPERLRAPVGEWFDMMSGI